MKNKTTTYILFALVFLIWGSIVYKMFFQTEDGDDGIANQNYVFKENKKSVLDTFSLALNYSDPFLKNEKYAPVRNKVARSSATKKNTPSVKKVKDNVVWPVVKYEGVIKHSNGETTAIVNINGTSHFLKAGNEVQEIKLCTISQDCIIVSYKNNKEMKKIYVFTLFMLFLMSFNSLFSQDYEKMFEEYKSKHHFQTVDSLYHYSFTVEAKSTLEPELNKTYTWYLNNAIHVSRGNYSGKLMNGSFVKYSKANNQMIEKGTYLLGVKQGLWYVWNADGTLSSYSEYKKGDLNGEFIEYADSNKCKFSGEFKKNLKSGWWYEYGNDRKVVAKT